MRVTTAFVQALVVAALAVPVAVASPSREAAEVVTSQSPAAVRTALPGIGAVETPVPRHRASERILTATLARRAQRVTTMLARRAQRVAARSHGRRSGAGCCAPRCPLANDREAVIRCFVRTAVTRRAPALGYDISTRGERAGLTRRQWGTGNIPVPMVPPPTGRVGFRLGPGRPTRLGREYVVFVGIWPMLVDVVRSSGSAPWRIDYFQPFPLVFVPA
jgi:hypothetical protein